MTYKTKFYATLCFSVLMLLIVYKVNIKKTLILHKEYSDIKSGIQSGKDAPERLLRLEEKLDNLNTMLGSKIAHSDLHEKIINSIINNPESKMINIWEFPKSVLYTDGNMNIYTNQLVLTSDFKSLVRYIYILETREKLSRIRSAGFKLKKMRGTLNEKLYVEIFLQNIEIAE